MFTHDPRSHISWKAEGNTFQYSTTWRSLEYCSIWNKVRNSVSVTELDPFGIKMNDWNLYLSCFQSKQYASQMHYWVEQRYSRSFISKLTTPYSTLAYSLFVDASLPLLFIFFVAGSSLATPM